MNLRPVLRLAALMATAAVLSSCLDVPEPTAPVGGIPGLVSGNLRFTALTAGDFHTCGLVADGSAFCWGLNSQGQAGYGLSPAEGIGTPLAVVGGFTFTKLYAGGAHTCGIQASGLALCWGNNVAGQVGDGSSSVRATPVAVTGGIEFTSLSTSTLSHTCGVNVTGQGFCWGQNTDGRLGDGTTANRNVPVPIAGGLTFSSVTAGGFHSCGLNLAGAAFCWGANGHGALGDGTNFDSPEPVAVSGGLVFTSLAAGLTHTCGVSSGGTTYCWGYNVVGSIGDGTSTSRNTPTPVSTAAAFQSIVAGERHSCGLTDTQETVCWGYNLSGALGDGTLVTRFAPVPMGTKIPFISLAAGGYHTCGLKADGIAYCWGDNTGRQLGH